MSRLAVCLAVVAATACSHTRDVSWVVRFRSAALATSATGGVEATIHDGSSCAGAVRYRTTATLGGPVPMPADPLPPGTYAFCARARDSSCTWFADGLTVVDTAHVGDTIVVELAASATPTSICPGACVAGACAGDDGGSPTDGGGVDAPVGFPDLGTSDLGCRAVSVTNVAAGGDTTCAVDSAGTVWCWGANDRGQLGAPGPDHARPVQVAGIGTAIGTVTVGGAHACVAVAVDAGVPTLRCWGANDHGQIGNGRTATSEPPTEVVGIGGTTASAGGAHTCAPGMNDAGVFVSFCWGANESGQLGTGGTTDALRPTETALTGFLVRCGTADTCATDFTSAAADCAGLNADGQLGRGTMPGDPHVPQPVPGIQTALPGHRHACGLVIGGAVACWGANESGQLGTGDTTPSTTPRPVTLPTHPSTLALGEAFTCASTVTFDDAGVHGSVLCWGAADEGQTGAAGATSTPQLAVSALSVTAGRAHACAIDVAGNGVICWGANDHGQLGVGAAGGHTAAPMPVCF